jgi:hypothetical protein
MANDIKEIKNRICSHVFTHGKKAGDKCVNRVTLKDKENNYKYCSFHYKTFNSRRFEKVCAEILLDTEDPSVEELKEISPPPPLIRCPPISPINYKEKYEELLQKISVISNPSSTSV